MSDRLVKWFGLRRRVKAIKLIQEHSELVKLSADELLNLLRAASEGRVESAREAFKTLANTEKQADDLRRRIVDELIRSDLPPVETSSLLRIAREADWIADWAHEAGRILNLLLERLPDQVLDYGLKLAVEVQKCAERVQACTDALLEDPARALTIADEIERIEEVVDGLYEDARRDVILAFDSMEIGVGTSLLCVSLLDAIENVADRCEDTADRIKEILVRILTKG